MWGEGFETTFYTGMLFRKMYCSSCGDKLKITKLSKIYEKGDAGFKNTINGKPVIGMKSIKISEYVYVCNRCKRYTTYPEQKFIAKRQKIAKKKVIDDYVIKD